ncbi:MAG: tetratricopeptide repeat protein [Bacteroidales bacterium]|jgi:outer membrane protein assembly factor BamD (BamD/ComL family)|nr:tetratricopeptide repeat protein [Bacteroidales bacterium]
MISSTRKIIGFGIAVLVLTACQISKKELGKEITRLENEIATEYNMEKMDSLSLLYQQYIKEYPQDSLVAEYLYKSGMLNISLRNGPEALTDLTVLANRFPKYAYLPEVYYYIAFIYEDIMYDIIAAKAAYYSFIDKYPNHRLLPDATLSIQYLGQSPEEIVATFQQNDTIHLEE